VRDSLCAAAVMLTLVGATACSGTAAAPAESSASAKATADKATPVGQSNGPAPAPLKLTYDKRTVGAEVRFSAAALPAGKTVDLTWNTVSGGWVVEDYYHFRGKRYSESSTSLGRFTVDANGRLEGRFTIPEDYGGVHDVIALADGKPVAQGGIEVTQSFEMSPASGAVGTPIEIRVKGLGWRTMESTWVVNWDNHLVGFVSAAGTKGTAVARFRASGPAGSHVIKMLTGWQAKGYLNYEQSPVAHLPRPEFTFDTTAGSAGQSTTFSDPYPKQPIKAAELQIANAKLTLSPTQGPVGTKATLRGEGFPRGKTLQLVWETYVGSRVSGNGFAPQERPLGTVTVSADGRIDHTVATPDDLGGLHALMLRDGNTMLARSYFVTETSIVSISRTSGPVGTPISIHLKGVGWTEYDNIYVLNYDNAYMGYVCGFNSQGDVVINFMASGAPGEHVIDLFPGIYQGPPTEPQLLYLTPQLTYADDHPGNKIPALHFNFTVTAGTGTR
jgi:hypothetical protein